MSFWGVQIFVNVQTPWKTNVIFWACGTYVAYLHPKCIAVGKSRSQLHWFIVLPNWRIYYALWAIFIITCLLYMLLKYSTTPHFSFLVHPRLTPVSALFSKIISEAEDARNSIDFHAIYSESNNNSNKWSLCLKRQWMFWKILLSVGTTTNADAIPNYSQDDFCFKSYGRPE